MMELVITVYLMLIFVLFSGTLLYEWFQERKLDNEEFWNRQVRVWERQCGSKYKTMYIS